MDWLEAMNRAVEYLEANITEKSDIEKVAKIALSSPFHFQRMYHMITGVTVAEYVRRRRLTLAAQDTLLFILFFCPLCHFFPLRLDTSFL